MTGRTILKEPVVFYRQANGEVVALEDRCAHRFAPLSMGHIVGGDRIQCPYHGLEYDKTGACVLQPHGNKNIPSRAGVKSYPVTEKHKAIWIWMGDPALADSVAGELICSEIEIRSGRGETFADAIVRQRDARARLFALAAAQDALLGATGTHPWSPWQDQRVIDVITGEMQFDRHADQALHVLKEAIGKAG